MIINSANIASLFQGFNASFNKGLQSAASRYKDVAMVIPSVSAESHYAWLGQFPKIREWVGDRAIKNLEVHDYALKNKLFESTVSIPRTDIEDDQFGVYSPLIEEIGRASGDHPDELIFSLLAQGFTTPCYDKENFFSATHPVGTGEALLGVSNMQEGSGPAWFLLDTSRSIKPLLCSGLIKTDTLNRLINLNQLKQGPSKNETKTPSIR